MRLKESPQEFKFHGPTDHLNKFYNLGKVTLARYSLDPSFQFVVSHREKTPPTLLKKVILTQMMGRDGVPVTKLDSLLQTSSKTTPLKWVDGSDPKSSSFFSEVDPLTIYFLQNENRIGLVPHLKYIVSENPSHCMDPQLKIQEIRPGDDW